MLREGLRQRPRPNSARTISAKASAGRAEDPASRATGNQAVRAATPVVVVVVVVLRLMRLVTRERVELAGEAT